MISKFLTHNTTVTQILRCARPYIHGWPNIILLIAMASHCFPYRVQRSIVKTIRKHIVVIR